MSAPILFVIHGMGVYKPGWEKEVTTVLETTRKDYPYLANAPLDALFRVMPISYDEEFEALRQLWREQA